MDIEGYLADAGLMNQTEDTYRRNLNLVKSWLSDNGLSHGSLSGQNFDRFVEDIKPHWSERSQEICLYAL